VPPERLFSGRAFLEQRPYFSANVHRDDPENPSLYTGWGVHAVLAAPVTTSDRRLGLVTVWSPQAPVFAESDLELVQLLAHQAAAVLESRRLLQQVAEARARDETDRLKDSFLASISHDLRNPLTAVAATAQLLRRRLDREGLLQVCAGHDINRDLVTGRGDARQMPHVGGIEATRQITARWRGRSDRGGPDRLARGAGSHARVLVHGEFDVLVNEVSVDCRTRSGTRRRGFNDESCDVGDVANRPHARCGGAPAWICFDPRANCSALCLHSECRDDVLVRDKVRHDEYGRAG
jgi:hypothetical protein